MYPTRQVTEFNQPQSSDKIKYKILYIGTFFDSEKNQKRNYKN
jgi:hypothetical protein